MTRDARLDAFASERAETADPAEAVEDEDVPSEDTGDTTDEVDTNADTDAAAEVDAGDSAPSLDITSEWSPKGGECATCGEVVKRRWRQDGALVCPDCKDWTEV